MGRMVSLFDLNLGVSTNKMLTERPHRDGLDLSQNWLELSSNTLQPSEHIEDKPISHESRCPLNNVASGTPMKMLLAQEMSKEGDSKQKPPNVVARLMGLDAIPALEPLYQSERSQFSPVFERNKYEGYSRSSKEKYHEEHHYIPIQVDTTPPETSIRRQQHRNGLKEKHSLPAIRSHCFVYEEEECRDVHEVRLSSTKERSNNQSLQKVSYNDNLDERKMDLVRQKFMEAKRLATDEKLRQSKEFQEALEVLSSNRELFLKFLQEPASLFAMGLDNLQSIQSIPPQTQSKRITVLKPSKAAIENGSWKQLNSSKRVVTAELKNDRLHRNGETENRSTKKHLIESKGPNENVSPWTSTFDQQSICYVRPQGEPDNLSHLTRIVVLKPSQRTVQDIRTVVASPPPKPHSRASHRSTLDRFMDASADENKDLPVREITTQMHESTSSHSLHSSSAREEPLFSSVLSNGYVGDESSHSRSENEYVGGNLSDSEVMTPTSRYSWDFVNRCNSYSSFLSRASYSPESSVNKEAKRRLSDRWVLMAHGNKERQLRRSSSTLGEMLSIPELKESTNLVGDTIEEVVGTSRSRSHAEHGNERSCVSSSKFTDFSPKRNVSRSRSVPASLRTFETLRKEDEARKSEQPRPIAKVEKPKNAKSFKGKLSSLFFSKNQKTSKEKCDPVPLLGKAQAGKSLTTDVSRSVPQRQLATTSNCGSSSSPLSNSHEQCITGSSSSPIIEPKDDRVMEAISSQTIPKSRERLLNQEQPSPVSVLEPPFEDESPRPPVMESNISDHQGTRRISLLDSVAATFSSGDPNLEDSRLADRGTAGEDPATVADEHKQLLFVQKLIAAAGLDGPYPFTAAISDQWYSSSGPLYPSLLEKLNEQDKGFSATNTKDAVSGGTKLQQVWLERRLLFNCVNAALLDIGQLALDVNPWLRMRSGTTKGVVPSGSALVEEVWRRLKKKFAVEEMVVTLGAAEGRDCVDKHLKRELETTGSDWTDLHLVEIDGIGREMQNGVLNDLIEDVISDIMHTCCHKIFHVNPVSTL